MKHYMLNPVSFKKILQELSDKLKAECCEKLGEYFVELPEELGEGHIRGINFPNGVGLIRYKFKLKTSIQLHFRGKQVHPLKFVYCAGSSVFHQFEKEKKWREISRARYAILASTGDLGHDVKFEKDVDIDMVSIEIDRRKFQDQFEYNLVKIDPVYYNLLGDINAVRRVRHEGYYNLNASMCMDDMSGFTGDDIVRTSFFGAKALEMFAYMLEQYKSELEESTPDILRLVDLHTLERAEIYLKENFNKKITIKKLARLVGTNENKLQKSFKVKHHQTVYQYLTDIRLQKSVEMLKSGNKPIGEIAELIGFSSRSHFTQLFKTTFGITPSSMMPKK